MARNVSFTVTNDILQNALDYAQRNNSMGAVFTFARTTDLDLDTPDVRDRYGNSVISDVKVTSNAVVLGRFCTAVSPMETAMRTRSLPSFPEC